MSFIKRSHKKSSFIRVPILEYFTSKLEMNPCVVLAILSSLLALQASADDICNGKDNGYYADPNNCIKYYHCFNGVTEEHITCPEGTRFLQFAAFDSHIYIYTTDKTKAKPKTSNLSFNRKWSSGDV